MPVLNASLFDLYRIGLIRLHEYALLRRPAHIEAKSHAQVTELVVGTMASRLAAPPLTVVAESALLYARSPEYGVFISEPLAV